MKIVEQGQRAANNILERKDDPAASTEREQILFLGSGKR